MPNVQAVQSSRGLSVKPPRPPLRHCRSLRSDGHVCDNMASMFSFPVTPVRVSPSADEQQWISTGYPDASEERSPSFQRWVPAQHQRSAGTSRSKGLYQLRHDRPWRVSVPTDERMSLQGDLSVSIGLTVQCSPMAATAVRTSAPSYVINTGGEVTPGYGTSAVAPVAVEPWRSSAPLRLVPVHSYNDDMTANYQPRWRTHPSHPDSVRAVSKFRSRRIHPVAGPGLAQSRPHRQLDRDFHIPHPSADPFPGDWKRQTQPFDDFAVGFDNDAAPFVCEDLASDVQGPAEFLDDEMAFHQITQQIASLTETVNELRFKHRRPTVDRGADNAVRAAWNSAALRAPDDNQRYRQHR